MKKKLLFVVGIAFVLELLLSNISFFNLVMCEKKNIVAKISTNEIKKGESSVIIDTEKIQIQNIKIYLKDSKKKKEIVEWQPEVNIYGMENETLVLNSKYSIGSDNTRININAENNCLKLVLSINNNNSKLLIDKIVINDTSIEFSLLRFIVILFILVLVFLFKNNYFNMLYNKYSKKQRLVYYGLVLVTLFIVYLVVYGHFGHVDLSFKDIYFYDSEFYNAQVEAFVNGNVSLMKKPPFKLTSLSNPYDMTVRAASNDALILSEFIDYSLYNNKFYVYFGVAPIILLMLPFKLITGYYISNFTVCMIGLIILSFLLARLYELLIQKYVSEVKYIYFLLGFITLFWTSTLALYAVGGSYYIASIFAIIFTLLSWILILSVDRIKSGFRLYVKMFFLGICMGFMVLSKPSFICYYIFLFYLLFNLLKKFDKKTIIKMVVSFSIPLAIIACFQMWYNYIRFNSVFEFGIKYQLTALDRENLVYISPIKIISGLTEYLFKLPNIRYDLFPFIEVPPNTSVISNNYNIRLYDWSILGIMVLPLSWIFLMYPYLKKKLNLSKSFLRMTRMLIITVIMILLSNIVGGGVAQVYITDVRIMFYMLCIIIYFKIFEKFKITILEKVFLIICIISLLIIIPVDLSSERNYFSNIDTHMEVSLKNLVEFWG